MGQRNFEQALERQRGLWAGSMQDRVLAAISLVPPNGIAKESLSGRPRHYGDIEKMWANWEETFRDRQEILDDWLPVAYVEMGAGLTGGYFGAELKFAGNASWTDPVLNTWDKLDNLKFDPDNYWVRKVMEGARYYVEHARGRYMVGVVSHLGPIDVANNLRGNQLFVDFYECPDKVHQLMDFAVDFTIQLVERQLEIVESYRGGVFESYGLGLWFPGRCTFTTEDAFCLCAPEFYHTFGRPYDQRLLDHFGSGWVHMHSLGLYFVSEVAKLDRLVAMQIGDDPNQPPVLRSLWDLRAKVGALPLLVGCSRDDFVRGLDEGTLPGGVFYGLSTTSVEDANQIMSRVLEYRAPRGFSRQPPG